MTLPLRSALYEGSIAHTRSAEPRHRFVVDVWMLYLDLDELPTLDLWPLFSVEGATPLSFRRRDYKRPLERALRDSVLDAVAAELGVRPAGRIGMLTFVRTLGIAFNPVSFYFCFDEREELVAVVAEITNTPWNERHSYVVPVRDGTGASTFEKRFHVSPFQPMAQRYEWQIRAPGPRLDVFMTNWEGPRATFTASLTLARRTLDRARLLRALTAHPPMPLLALARIYAHAAALALKRAPFFPHPRSVDGAT